MLQPALPQIIGALSAKGFPFAQGDKAINLVGIRRAQRDEFFCDTLALLFADNTEAEFFPLASDCEQDTGPHQLLPTGHYREALRIGIYAGRYWTLADNSGDGIVICHGGINPYTLETRHWSGNAQIVPGTAELMSLFDRAKSSGQSVFHYVLIDEADLISPVTETSTKDK